MSPDDSSRIVTDKGAECSNAVVPPDPGRRSQVSNAVAPIGAPSTTTLATSDDATEAAIARALDRAAAAGRFDVVSQLARELEARRLARTPNVVRFDDGRERKR